MEVDDEIVCRGSRWLFHLMKHFSRQLTAAGLGNRRQLTIEGQFRILHVFLSLMICVNNNFPILIHHNRLNQCFATRKFTSTRFA